MRKPQTVAEEKWKTPDVEEGKTAAEEELGDGGQRRVGAMDEEKNTNAYEKTQTMAGKETPDKYLIIGGNQL